MSFCNHLRHLTRRNAMKSIIITPKFPNGYLHRCQFLSTKGKPSVDLPISRVMEKAKIQQLRKLLTVLQVHQQQLVPSHSSVCCTVADHFSYDHVQIRNQPREMMETTIQHKDWHTELTRFRRQMIQLPRTDSAKKKKKSQQLHIEHMEQASSKLHPQSSYNLSQNVQQPARKSADREEAEKQIDELKLLLDTEYLSNDKRMSLQQHYESLSKQLLKPNSSKVSSPFKNKGIPELQFSRESLGLQPLQEIVEETLIDVDEEKYIAEGSELNAEKRKKLMAAVNQMIDKLMGKKKEQLMQKTIAEMKQRKIRLYQQELAAFVDVCIHNKNLKDAHRVLTMLYLDAKSSPKESGHKTTAEYPYTEVYSMLMTAFANQGDHRAVDRLMAHLLDLSVKASASCFAAHLQALGQGQGSQQAVAKVLRNMKKQRVHLADVLMHPLSDSQLSAISSALSLCKVALPLTDKKPHHQAYQCASLVQYTENSKHVNPHLSVNTGDPSKQIQTELSDHVVVKSIVPPTAVTSRVSTARAYLAAVQDSWRKDLSTAFIRQRQQLTKQSRKDLKLSILPYIDIFEPEVYVDLMMQHIDEAGYDMAVYSPDMLFLELKLGQQVFRKYLKHRNNNLLPQLEAVYRQYCQMYSQTELQGNPRELWENLCRDHGVGHLPDLSVPHWPYKILRKVGKFLYNLILYDIKIDQNCLQSSEERHLVPGFYTVFRPAYKMTVEQLKPHPALVRLYKNCHQEELRFDPSAMPSLCSPVPWCSLNYGADLLGKTPLVTNTPAFSRPAMAKQQLFPVLDALNCVASTPWVINQKVLDVLIQVFNSGGNVKLSIPQPESAFPDPPTVPSDIPPEQRLKLQKQRLELQQDKKEMYSLWCTELYRLSIANQFRDSTFYFPHNLDFRGRCYAVAPHFSHIGGDIARSTLQFAQGKPLGESGLDWLKIHLVNLTGQMKRSANADRLAFANQLMDEILDSADQPLTGRCWWQSSEEPWQTLAACIEIARAVRSGDPQSHMCHHPVHQDGSCNGLQHYAALGRDQAGAESVNLRQFEVPKDVYSDVVTLVERERQFDASNGLEIANILEGYVLRKVIKQTIMTTVYGVTHYGAKLQIKRQLEAVDFPQQHVQIASTYLTDKTFKCLCQMFTSTKQIQDWLVLCAHVISQKFQTVSWTTPLGLTVTQPYLRYSTATYNSQKISLEKPNTVKQKAAFPPNYIHSLDATHMMLTALKCFQQGITFVSVHDCFWTHPSDVPAMNKICREQFVTLHRQPLLENLAEQMVARYGYSKSDLERAPADVKEAMMFFNSILTNVPKRGAFNLDEVIDSTYFFS